MREESDVIRPLQSSCSAASILGSPKWTRSRGTLFILSRISKRRSVCVCARKCYWTPGGKLLKSREKILNFVFTHWSLSRYERLHSHSLLSLNPHSPSFYCPRAKPWTQLIVSQSEQGEGWLVPATPLRRSCNPHIARLWRLIVSSKQLRKC